ncbi:unnamed protein product [Diatraea saccharalis]|uniref:Uncharacterized protein n=1 Tax=Diatraea saccharalis TaxID=40085 RepID=A0A9N9R5Q8_9NEOP|nr:unnamed protein product [Diatraea saccharalis]
MPRTTKLHNKRKPTSIQKSHKVEDDGDTDPEESIRKFQLELCWCIQQLERSINDTKGNEKQLQEAWKVLTVLKSNNQPVIRKRQLMRTHFGDYRAKMAAEEKKLAKMTRKIKIAEVPDKPKATFLRKSAFLSTGDNAFRFNFNLAPEEVDNNQFHTDSNIPNEENKLSKLNDECCTKKEDNTKHFKFSFSESAFKFNFNVDRSDS